MASLRLWCSPPDPLLPLAFLPWRAVLAPDLFSQPSNPPRRTVDNAPLPCRAPRSCSILCIYTKCMTENTSIYRNTCRLWQLVPCVPEHSTGRSPLVGVLLTQFPTLPRRAKPHRMSLDFRLNSVTFFFLGGEYSPANKFEVITSSWRTGSSDWK